MNATAGRTEDPLWPRAASLLGKAQSEGSIDIALLGVPTYLNSISPTRANETPTAIRAALQKYSTHFAAGADLASLSWCDFGDIRDPDSELGELDTTSRVAELLTKTGLLIALGGDNSLTYSVSMGLRRFAPSDQIGLVTLDAHHDLRDGISNGSPIRRLIEGGLDPRRIVQIGIADFSNSPHYAKRAKDLGIRVITRTELEERPLAEVVSEATSIAGHLFHLDIDVDVCDRSVVPATPAAAPGGISAYQLRLLARLFAQNTGLKSADIAEISAPDDSPDGRTVRLGALVVLELAAGYRLRSRGKRIAPN